MKLGMTTFGGDGGKSGISQYIMNLLREFATLKPAELIEVFVYANEEKIFVPHKNGISPLCFGEGIRRPVVNLLWHQISLPRWCRRGKYDVLFLPAGNRRLPVSVPCPTVGTVHDFSSIHVKGKYDPARMFYITRVLPVLIRRLTQVITVSESSKKDIVEYAGVPEERVHVTPLAADNSLYHPRDKEQAAARVASRYGLRPPYILYISRIEHPGKNHARLIRAFDRLKSTEDIPHQLVLAGSDWVRAEEVHRAAEECSCTSDIVFTGFAATEDIPDLYCGADLFVFPSLYEGFGLPVLEAMASAVPTACSNVSSIPEVAGDAALQFDPYDEEAIAEAIRTLLTNPELRADYGKRGLERSKQFTWSRTASRTLAVIRAAVAEAEGP